MSLYSRDDFELKVFRNSRAKGNSELSPLYPKRLKILMKDASSPRRKETLTREE